MRNDKVRNYEDDLKGFQQLETLFLQASVTIWHLLIRERVRKKKKRKYTFKKTTERQCFLQKQSMILQKVLFTLIDDLLMYRDLPLLSK